MNHTEETTSTAPEDADASTNVNDVTDSDSPDAEQSNGGGGSEAPAAASGPPAAAAAIGDAVVEERDKLKEQLLRMAADFENYRRRARRESGEAKMRGKDEAVLELLPVVDNLERAVGAAEGASEIASVVEGVKMVLKLFEDTSERMGLKRIDTIGERFDPAVHEAIQQEETDKHPAGCITQEVMPGYMFGQRLLRAAMVVVARPPSKPASSDAPAEASDTTETAEDAPATSGGDGTESSSDNASVPAAPGAPKGDE